MERSSSKGKRIRASRPKVRSGCITCKERHVKCDETKPECLRCKKFGRNCDGYVPAQQGRQTLIPLQPRPSYANVCTPVLSLSGDEQERHYYQLFCDQTVSEFAGFSPTDSWKRIVLQESHSEPIIRHAVVALGALTESLRESEDQPFGMIPPLSSASIEHHRFALSQYNKAVVNLEQSLSKGKPQIRTVLMACLLFICFENSHGDYDAAAKHMQRGLNLLDQYQSQDVPGGLDSHCNQNQLEKLHNDEVYQMFVRLNVQSFTHIDSAMSLDPNLRLSFREGAERESILVPAIFTDVFEAKCCWDILIKRCIDYYRMSSSHKYDMDIPQWIFEEADACTAQLQQFENAFWPVLSYPGDDLSLIDNGAVVLYLCNKISIMYLQLSVLRGESHWDSYTQQFEEIIGKSTKVVERIRVIDATQSAASAFEFGIIPPLHLTALKCRDRRIRQQAIALLLSCPRREGYWDGVLLGKVDTWIMQLEEEGMDETGFIPELSRWRLGEIKSSPQDRWIWIKCLQDSYNWDGQWCFATGVRETRITW